VGACGCAGWWLLIPLSEWPDEGLGWGKGRGEEEEAVVRSVVF
jgi:hypothetical protein